MIMREKAINAVKICMKSRLIRFEGPLQYCLLSWNDDDDVDETIVIACNKR